MKREDWKKTAENSRTLAIDRTDLPGLPMASKSGSRDANAGAIKEKPGLPSSEGDELKVREQLAVFVPEIVREILENVSRGRDDLFVLDLEGF